MINILKSQLPGPRFQNILKCVTTTLVTICLFCIQRQFGTYDFYFPFKSWLNPLITALVILTTMVSSTVFSSGGLREETDFRDLKCNPNLIYKQLPQLPEPVFSILGSQKCAAIFAQMIYRWNSTPFHKFGIMIHSTR